MTTAIIADAGTSPATLALAFASAELGAARPDTYLRCVGLDPARREYPWCAAFVSWAIREAGLRSGPLRFRGSASVSNLLRRNSALLIDISACQPGDVLLHISPEGNHCGFFTRERGYQYSVQSLEGNVRGRIKTATMPLGYWTHALRVI